MQCPSCGASSMRPVTYEGVTLENCGSCGGFWLDEPELRIINAVREKKFDRETCEAIGNQTGVQGVRLEDVDRDLKCPKCAGETDAVNFVGNTGIIIVRCSSCGGLWLDKGELAHIQQVVEGWEASLSGDLARFGSKLDGVRQDIHNNLDKADDVSTLPGPIGAFMNMLIGGVLRITR